MSNKVRYILDTNLIISALLFKNSTPAKAFRYTLNHGEVLSSLELLEELSEVLGRGKFDRYVTSEEREEFLESLIERIVLIQPVETVQVCRDPKDDMVLSLALSGKANYIISGDNDLLVLNPFRNIKIVTAEDFLLGSEEAEENS
ncbi:MAG: putative toxin-antitoxin system toxin component, PIN family [Tildeniella nuda ZEHNDER 1965/U140]|jgi:putative PIN family toxin of toxin-antitoxin system|nr:putative toxin-antitoxin system toxin component, PIN family [Tildeniella nuda ZEHNDER 1965/U140]